MRNFIGEHWSVGNTLVHSKLYIVNSVISDEVINTSSLSESTSTCLQFSSHFPFYSGHRVFNCFYFTFLHIVSGLRQPYFRTVQTRFWRHANHFYDAFPCLATETLCTTWILNLSLCLYTTKHAFQICWPVISYLIAATNLPATILVENPTTANYFLCYPER